MSTDKFKKATAFRQIEINRVTELYNLAKKAVNDNSCHSEFKQRYRHINNMYTEFDKQQCIIISLVISQDELFNNEDQVRADFECSYYYIKSVFAELFENELTNSGNNSNVANTNLLPKVKLPEIKINKFNGDIKQFTAFIDIYNALIHNNASLSNIEKFTHLHSYLEGAPKALIQCTPLTSANYLVAYNALVERYTNNRILATAHWNEIETTQRLTSENPQLLRKLIDIFTENIAALTNLRYPTAQWDFILVNMLLKRIDPITLSRFEINHASSILPTFKDLIDFLNKQCLAYDSIAFSSTPKKDQKKPFSQQRHLASALFLNTAESPRKCPLCSSNHNIYQCPKFIDKNPQERFTIIKQNRWCLNCLSNTHNTFKCNSTHTCRLCNSRHHSLLHFNRHNNQQNPRQQTLASAFFNPQPTPASSFSRTIQQNSNLNTNCAEVRQIVPNLPATNSLSDNNISESATGQSPVESLATFSNTQKPGNIDNKNNYSNSAVLLGTLKIDILDCRGNYQTVRALLDCASQANFISKKCVSRLGLVPHKVSLSVCGLSDMSKNLNSGAVNCAIKPTNKLSPIFHLEAVMLDKICNDQPTFSSLPNNWPHTINLKLADQHFNKPSPVDLLLNAHIFSQALSEGCIQGNENAPTAINTVFGWILMGQISNINNLENINSFFTTVDSNLEKTVSRFWELEEVPQVKPISPDEKQCEQYFKNSFLRLKNGRFLVSLPFRNNIEPSFVDSRSVAYRRFLSLERRLTREPQLHKLYCDFMKDYITAGHMEKLETNIISKCDSSYYIPHHSVLKPDSTTTKLRVVFDASAKDVNNNALNDFLLVGPKLQNDILSILLHFRLHKFVFTADIRQMYRQILVNKSHRHFQKILFRFSPNDNLDVYQLNTVTYGVSSAPFLAIRTLMQLAEDEKHNFPTASKILISDTYVDDIVTGAQSLDACLQLQTELISLLNKGGFQLRKWCSNCPELLINLPQDHLYNELISFSDERSNETIKILGLKWNPLKDYFTYSVEPLNRDCTKRNMLSDLARIYDPNGFCSPLSFICKLKIQYLWSLGIDWDATPPQHIINFWKTFKSELPELKNLKIPRHIQGNLNEFCEMHGFCDASEAGYCAVVYFRVQNTENNFSCYFISAKSKVAPLKRISIPRLELCAAVLLANLMTFILDVYREKINFTNIFSWSDSTVVLSWIKSSPHKWTTFVSNRVTLIQDKISPSFWHHINTKDNPADCGSRGLLPRDLLHCAKWWVGPEWLGLPQLLWPNSEFNLKDTQEEIKTSALVSNIEFNIVDMLLNKFSSLSKILNIISYIIRFITFIKTKSKIKGPLLPNETQLALHVLIKRTQALHFSQDLTLLSSGKLTTNLIKKLNPFLLNDIIRVGGRIRHADVPYDQKHPILLPRKCRLTKLIIEGTHKRYLHPGCQALQYILSQNFWILSARRAIKEVVSKCIQCWRLKPKPLQPPMGDLPVTRISQIKPFSIVGTDYCGPFNITINRSRGSKTKKAWVCLFVCFATKAIHIELASDLSSDCFLAAFRRFIARRGRCSAVYSDCGTNYVGANKYIKNIMQGVVESEKIVWHFNPPASPHFSGLMEAGVKSVKTHLFRVIGLQILTYEEFITLLTQIEAILNSRPLCPLSNDPNDLTVLTPGHFLTLEPLSALPDPNLEDIKINRLNRWQLLQRFHTDFWSRWSNEYLHTLHQRGKWTNQTNLVVPGTLCLIKHENFSPLTWQLGRIIELHPGADGVARVATVRTKQGSFKRPLVKLCPLPLQ